MRGHSHDVEEGQELRPKADRIESDDTGLIYEAAAGRTDVLGPAGMLGLQRAVGDAGSPVGRRGALSGTRGVGLRQPRWTGTPAPTWSPGSGTTSVTSGCTPTRRRTTRRRRSTRMPTPSTFALCCELAG